MTIPTRLNVNRPEAEGYGALLEYGDDYGEDLYLQLAVSAENPLEIATLNTTQSNLPNVATKPEEYRPDLGMIYARSRFSNGEGLDFAHRAGGSAWDDARFWDSKGVDVVAPEPGDPEEIRLTARTERNYAAANTNLHMLLRGTEVVFSSGQYVRRTSNPFDETPTVSSDDMGSYVYGIAVIGNVIYAAESGTLNVKAGAGAWGTLGSYGYTGLWATKQRLFGTDSSGTLWEINTSTGDRVAQKILSGGDSWTFVADGGNVIMAGATDGLIYSFTIENNELVLKAEAPIALGEVPCSMAFVQGLVLIGTYDSTGAGGKIGRVWAGQLIGLRIQELQLLREFGSGATSADWSPQRMIATRDSVYFGVYEESYSALWRYQLATAGLSRHLIYATAAPVPGIVALDEKLLATVYNSGLFRQMDIYYPTGWLIAPLADFYSAASKSWVGMRIDHDEITSNEEILVYYSTERAAIEDPDHASWTLAERIRSGQVTTEVGLSEVKGRYLTFKVVMNASSGGVTSPVVRSVSFRALEQLDDTVMSLPVNVSDQLERPGRKPLRIRGRGDELWTKLKSLEGLPATVTVLRNGFVVRGQLEQVAIPIQAITPRGSIGYVSLLRVRGAKE